MFCYQCEQTAMGKGCTKMGVCGKDPETADLQDLLVYAAKGIAFYAHRLRAMNVIDKEADKFIVEALFTTVTNVNFDPVRLEAIIAKAGQIKDRLQADYLKKAGGAAQKPTDAAGWKAPKNRAEMLNQAAALSIAKKVDALGADVAGLQELITYGLKGTAAYADHAAVLGKEDPGVYAFFHEALDFLTSPKATDVNELVGMSMKVGEVNLKAMELLDAANTGVYGHPEPTQVRITAVKGKAILVSGHDLKDLELLLKQTEGKGVNIYTHGEMLPCNAYPGLKKYKHLVGNYGGAWQDQHKEFDAFPGSILMTTNCIQRPKDSYKDRIFTTGLVAWPGVKHIADKNFEPVIKSALAARGFDHRRP